MKKSSISKNFVIVANAALGKGFSGSDRIFIELAKKLKEKLIVRVCVWEEGFEMCQRQNLNGVIFEKWFLGRYKNLPFVLNYLFRIFTGTYYALEFKISNNEVKNYTFYSASDFWQDFIPFLVFKLRFPNALFIGSYYLAAPNPFIGYRKEYEKAIQIPKIKDILFYLQHLIPKFFLPIISDYILVTSDPDKSYFIKKGFSEKKIFSIMGGVNFENYLNLPKNVNKKYDAVFYGRFHPQKGVLEILDIWVKLLKFKPEAKLVMIGDGPLYNLVLERIKKYSLEDKITLMGIWMILLKS